MAGLSQINIPSLKKLYSGKVRDTFAVGDDKPVSYTHLTLPTT